MYNKELPDSLLAPFLFVIHLYVTKQKKKKKHYLTLCKCSLQTTYVVKINQISPR